MFYSKRSDVNYVEISENPNKSVLEPKKVVSNDHCFIDVCVHGASRTIFIEYGSDSKRLFKYEISFPNGGLQSDAASGWMVSEIVGGELGGISWKIQKFRNACDSHHMFDASEQRVKDFKLLMDKHVKTTWILNGDQDEQIESALGEAKIDSQFQVPKTTSGCIIS